jgi:hypothetical protein
MIISIIVGQHVILWRHVVSQYVFEAHIANLPAALFSYASTQCCLDPFDWVSKVNQ